MTRVTFDVPAQLTADSTPAGSHRVAGLLVPWDKPGRTSLGELSVQRGALTLPDPGRLRLLYGHDRNLPIGTAVGLDDADDGLHGQFAIARTSLGAEYLAELDPEVPIRDGLSVEIDDVEIDGSTIVAGQLVAVAAVPLPAYTDARAALAASLHEKEHTVPELTAVDAPDSAVQASESPVPPLNPVTRAPARTQPVSALQVLCADLSEGRLTGTVGARLAAALADIKPSGNGAGNADAGLVIQAVGELWQASSYVQRYAPLVASGQLNGIKVQGFAWTVPPAVDDYLGEKSAIPSNAATLDFVEVAATRLAGGHDIDRIYRDLGNAAVMQSYWSEMGVSLAKGLDGRALTAIQSAAGTGVAAGSALEAIVLGSIAVSSYGPPSYALISSDLAADMALTPAADAPVGAPFSLPPIIVGPELPAGTVIVGVRQAVTQYTFTPPIRVEAVNIPNGGIDAGLFSYSAEMVNQPAAVVAYTVTVGP